ncbi:MAG TPA: amino acid adenylation domain-containing protein [Verrucomicrobiae bacterium]|nr:amino acid adenylation domain-containing protein [Verrucomicrobiae bacterium]
MQINVLEYLERGPLLKWRDKLAIVDRDHRLTFGEIERFAKNCASLILRQTSTRNRPIAVFLPKSAEAIIANLGILYTGNCYANLDIKSPPQRLRSMLQNLQASLVITSASLVAALRAAGVPGNQLLLVEQALTPEAIYDNPRLLSRLESVIDTDPVYIIYTSGSTGIPKGVVIPHRGVIDYIDWARACYQISESEVIGNQAPFFFDNSILDIYLCLSCGATLVLIPEEIFGYPLKLMQFVEQACVTTFFWVPSVMTSVANYKILDSLAPPSLRKILFAGEVMPTKTLNYWRRKYPRALFSNLYGPTEITVDCTYYTVDRDFSDDEALPIGFPCRNTDILILNEKNEAAQPNEAGELCVRGSSLALGYWNNPEKTAMVLVQNPLNPHYPELIYRTGDLVSRNARGEIMFIGRKDFQIKHLGYRIELGEIEHAVFQVDGIRNGCVVYNQSKKEIALFFESEQELKPGFIRDQLLAHVPKYMLPTSFHRLDRIPLTANGKIDRQKLVSSLDLDGHAAR